jgi:hypothetical protein
MKGAVAVPRTGILAPVVGRLQAVAANIKKVAARKSANEWLLFLKIVILIA